MSPLKRFTALLRHMQSGDLHRFRKRLMYVKNGWVLKALLRRCWRYDYSSTVRRFLNDRLFTLDQVH